MGTATALDVRKVRADFPILSRKVRNKPLVYLDNAATTQKPRAVLDAIRTYYETENSNIHRGVHYLSELATKSYEGARNKARAFLNAADAREIVFVRGATEAINLVANSFGRAFLRAGDEVLVTAMEHHSNIVPWQILRDERGIVLQVAPIADDGSLVLAEFEKRLTPKTKLVSIAHVSNALGTVNPVKRIVEMAHARG
ncbi:MAG TPA: aminotransferase class V-fold PLP-dependent enzyme, partial [Planctomycetota bacterium]|nr:aminotransferase class V-fold PLP-dependent enzyme [Planctomycetota bacterium]